MGDVEDGFRAFQMLEGTIVKAPIGARGIAALDFFRPRIFCDFTSYSWRSPPPLIILDAGESQLEREIHVLLHEFAHYAPRHWWLVQPYNLEHPPTEHIIDEAAKVTRRTNFRLVQYVRDLLPKVPNDAEYVQRVFELQDAIVLDKSPKVVPKPWKPLVMKSPEGFRTGAY